MEDPPSADDEYYMAWSAVLESDLTPVLMTGDIDAVIDLALLWEPFACAAAATLRFALVRLLGLGGARCFLVLGVVNP